MVEVDELFDQADVNHVERITLTQFLAQYHMRKRLGEEVNLITETLVPSVNLFEALDPSNTGYSRNIYIEFLTCLVSILNLHN